MKRQIIEGLIFLSGDEGIDSTQLAEISECELDEVKDALDELKLHHEKSDSSLELVLYANKYKFVTKSFLYEYAKKLLDVNKVKQLSQSALETLAIIAYKQPITRLEIEELRGVGSEVMLRKLLAMDLISEAGRLETPGRPILYQVTDLFLDGFKMSTLEELPELDVVTQENDEDLFQ
ncbi:MAG: SMC-Scp complex subunit ScpB [Erysipelothrix sp.]|nr:SMC-Scp complex subunit ScpB [Erysipelothrix sp.]